MRRSRGTEMGQRPSPRGPLQLRTSSLDSDASHSTTMSNRSTYDRTTKLCDRRSPRSTLPEPKKRGTRIADLESQLNQTQEELKKLKEQLASSEAAKKEAQQELENAKKQQQASEDKDLQETHQSQAKESATEEAVLIKQEAPSLETDVFEVPPATMPVESKVESVETIVGQEEEEEEVTSEPKSVEEEFTVTVNETEKQSELPENPEITELKAKLAEKEKELESFTAENDGLKKLALEVETALALIKAKEEDSALKLSRRTEELEESNERAARAEEQLKSVEGTKVELENEMKRLRVQTEQWRKAADAAAAVLAGGVEMNGRRVGERCGSMDKHLGAGGFDAAGYVGYGSPMMELDDEGLGGGKRKGAGIRMFGDLWKKKGQK